MLKQFSYIGACAMMAIVLASASAKAETLGPEPDGIQAGGFVLHPGATFSIGYNSMGARSDVNSAGDGLVDIGAHLKAKRLNDDIHAWDNELSFNWRQFFGLGDEVASGGPAVRLTSTADLFKESFLRISPSISYAYLDEPEDENLQRDLKNHTLRVGSSFLLQPGQGAIFSQRLGYFFNGRIYQDFSGLTFFDHRFDATTRWSFLPETSMALAIDFRIIHYLESTRPTSARGVSDEQPNHTALPIRIRYSLQGLTLARLSYELGLGYSYAYYGSVAKAHMFIMNAGLKYAFTEDTKIFIDYRKDHENALYGDFYQFHRVNLGFDALWFKHLQTSASIGYGYFTFRSGGTEIRDDETLDVLINVRSDHLLTAQANIDYSFMPGLRLGLEYKLRYNNSSISIAEYTKHVITLNFSYEY